VAGRARSFTHAFMGLRDVIGTQRNAWIHAAATAFVVVAGIALDATRLDWCWLVAAIAAVWVAEAFNTALEALADAAVPELHPKIRVAKDAAAGAVLVAAAAAALIGILILGRPLLLRFVG
jgi:diacylglycerol kinase (ATP)